MKRKARGQPPKPVLAIPSEPVRKAGAKELVFPSVKAAAYYFGMIPACLDRVLVHGTKKIPTCGYYFDYAITED